MDEFFFVIGAIIGMFALMGCACVFSCWYEEYSRQNEYSDLQAEQTPIV